MKNTRCVSVGILELFCEITDVVIVCTACQAVSEMASFFNRPLFSWVATDPDFDDKVTHSTLTRTLGPFRKLALYLPQILQQYNWKRVVVISSNYLHYGDVGRAIRRVLAETNFTVAHASDYYRPLLDSYIRNTLYKTSIEGRSTSPPF